MGGGGKGQAKKQQDQELDRQNRVKAATDRVNTLFNGGTSSLFDSEAYLAANPDVAADSYWGSVPQIHYNQHGKQEGRAAPMNTVTVDPNARQKLYDEQKTAVFDINKRDIDQQYDIAERDNRFGLARAGLMGGSADVDSNALLQRKTNDGLIKAGGIADNAAADLRMADESTRGNLINMAQSGVDTGTLTNSALNTLSANAQGANAARTGATIGNLFDNLGGAYLYNQQAKGNAAGMNMFPTNPYNNMNPRNTNDGSVISRS